jgi:tetratricopeptide (TPR) repeat protein
LTHSMPGSVFSCRSLLTLLIVTVLSIGAVAGEAPESLRLRHIFKPGSEAVYGFESAMEQDSTMKGEKLYHKMTLDGSLRETVVGFRGDTALVGWLATGRWQLREGADTEGEANDQVWIASHRITDRGESLRRKFSVTNAQHYIRYRAVNQFAEAMQVFAAFAEQAVSPGDKWEGDVLLPLPGARQVGRAVTTLIAINRNNGRTVCTLKSVFRSGGDKSFDTWQTSAILPKMTVTGAAQGLFEAERGIWLDMKVDMKAMIEGPDFAGAIDIRSRRRLKSYQQGAGPGSLASRKRFAEFENALRVMCDGDLEKSIEMLERQDADSEDEDWSKGLEVTLAILRGVKQNEEQEAGDKKLQEQPAWEQGPAAEAYRQAGAHAAAGELERAAAGYERFLSIQDSGVPGNMRILARYRLAGILVELGRRDDALAAYRAVQSMSADDDYSKRLKEQALKKATELEQVE